MPWAVVVVFSIGWIVALPIAGGKGWAHHLLLAVAILAAAVRLVRGRSVEKPGAKPHPGSYKGFLARQTTAQRRRRKKRG